MPMSGWAESDLLTSNWVINELLKNDHELLFADPASHAEANPMLPPTGFPEDFFMGGVEESANSSSAGSPSSLSSVSSAASAPEVPVTSDLPAGSPATLAPITHVESKIEMVAAVPQDLKSDVEDTPSGSHKRKNSTSSLRKEPDTKAAAPVQQMSKRARANERNRKREAHNQAERERRDDLKEGYAGLRMVLPTHLCPDRKNQVDLLQAATTYITILQSDFARMEKELSTLRAQAHVAAPESATAAPAPSS